MADQTTGTLSFDRLRATLTAATTLGTEIRADASANKAEISWFLDLDPTTAAQVSEIVIAAGSTSDIYSVTITGGSQPAKSKVYLQLAGDTAETIAAELAELIDSDPRVTAKIAGTGVDASRIIVTGAIRGQSFTLANTRSTTTANVTITTPTPAAGTPKNAQVLKTTLNYSFFKTGVGAAEVTKPRVNVVHQWYDGKVPSATFQAPVSGNADGPVDLGGMLDSAAIPKPA